MKTILCTGDSHTWGQGVPGLLESFSPPVEAGEKRLAPFGFPCYVNLLREAVNKKTGSAAREFSSAELPSHGPLEYEGELIRLQLTCRGTGRAEVLLDGGPAGEAEFFGADTQTAYKNLSFFRAPGKHSLEIKVKEGAVSLYRAEAYCGRAAVVNSGIGSCPAERFFSEFYEDYVAALRPDTVIMEAHTINDWLLGDPPETYRARLVNAISRLSRQGIRVILVTVSPILGEQALPFNRFPYESFIRQSRLAAAQTDTPLCDANALMKKLVSGLDSSGAAELLFADNWHVNALGHRIYAESIYRALSENNII